MVRGSEASAEDSLKAYRATNSRAKQAKLEALLGIREAAASTAVSNSEILAGIRDIKNDPTGRRTLALTMFVATIAFFTVLATYGFRMLKTGQKPQSQRRPKRIVQFNIQTTSD